MTFKIKLYILAILAIFAVSNASAQKDKNVSGEYVYVQGENDTPKEAKMIAVEKARVVALSEEFGTLINQLNQTSTKDGKTNFISYGLSEVKGEWLADTKAPEISVSIDPKTGRQVIRAKVWGKAREIVGAGLDVDALVLKNGTDVRFEDHAFKDGDMMYLSFKAPVNGYLLVYLMDENEQAYRLLPYRKANMYSYPVEADREYIFFSKSNPNPADDRAKILEYNLTASHAVEHNRIYVIFSPNEFSRPTDNVNRGMLPPTLSFADFQKWLVDNRTRDAKMMMIPWDITISQR